MLLFRLPPKGLDVELRTVRDLGFVGPASALMFEGERGRRGDTAMIVYARKETRSTKITMGEILPREGRQ